MNRIPDPFPYRPEAFTSIPCQCGNPDASWHGKKHGYRSYSCQECWQDDPESNQVWITAADLNMNYSNEWNHLHQNRKRLTAPFPQPLSKVDRMPVKPSHESYGEREVTGKTPALLWTLPTLQATRPDEIPTHQRRRGKRTSCRIPAQDLPIPWSRTPRTLHPIRQRERNRHPSPLKPPPHYEKNTRNTRTFPMDGKKQIRTKGDYWNWKSNQKRFWSNQKLWKTWKIAKRIPIFWENVQALCICKYPQWITKCFQQITKPPPPPWT